MTLLFHFILHCIKLSKILTTQVHAHVYIKNDAISLMLYGLYVSAYVN